GVHVWCVDDRVNSILCPGGRCALWHQNTRGLGEQQVRRSGRQVGRHRQVNPGVGLLPAGGPTPEEPSDGTDQTSLVLGGANSWHTLVVVGQSVGVSGVPSVIDRHCRERWGMSLGRPSYVLVRQRHRGLSSAYESRIARW